MVLILAFAVVDSHTNGIDGNGPGARSMAMGGTDVARASDALGAMAVNPAGHVLLDAAEFNLGMFAGVLNRHFNQAGFSGGGPDDSLHAFPVSAIACMCKNLPVAIGLSMIPDSRSLAYSQPLDASSELGRTTSYRQQKDESELVLAAAAAVKSDSELSPAVVGLLSNENIRLTPCIFQNVSPAVDGNFDGARALLNLQTTGVGWNTMAAFLFQPMSKLDVGLSYKSTSIFNTGGQFGGQPGLLAFHYDADMKNKFPQEISAGASWKFSPKWRGGMQVDWTGWSDGFNSLPVSSTGGSSSKAGGVPGSSVGYNIPANWSDEFVYRLGFEYEMTDRLALRAGYAYGQSPMPESTLLPPTAAILEHAFSAGIGYRWRRLQVDLDYQYALPAAQNAGASEPHAGESSNSSTAVRAHMIALTAGLRF